MRIRVFAIVVCSVMIAGMPSVTAAPPERWQVTSPDGSLVFELSLETGAKGKGALSYTLTHRHDGMTREVLAKSPLGIRRDDQAFVDGLRLASPVTRGGFGAGSGGLKLAESLSGIHGKRGTIQYAGNEAVFKFQNGSGAGLDLVVRVFNDGAAFRYRFPESDDRSRRVLEEATGFAVPTGATGWMLPQQAVSKYGPAYEAMFVEVPSGTNAPTPSGWSFPALFSIDNGREWLLITEADLTDSYAGTRLASDARGGHYHVRLPEAGEGNGVGQLEPESSLPWTMPWRVLMVGSTPAGIVESTLVEDLSAPAQFDASWVQPGRVSWSWWSDDDSPRNEKSLDSFIDLAAEMGWEYSLIDANWNLMDPAALQRVLAHAKEKKIGILLWYNSGGPHNDVTEQPRDRMFDREIRRQEMAKLRDWGVKGIKVDFWQSDKQDRIKQYLDVLRDAAEFHLMVDFHGCTLPRGWSRTYPNLMSMEAVPGAEQYKFNPEYAKKAAWHNTVLVFTRNVVGPMDYTPVTVTDHKYPHLTSYGHELALSVVFESGLQHFADSVAAYEGLPAEAKAFLSTVPAAWQDTQLMAGTPGKLAVVARGAKDAWYVGGITGSDDPQSLDVDLSFIGTGPHTATLITDAAGNPKQLSASTQPVTSSTKLHVPLLPRGGFVLKIVSSK
jgi:alpha-glucosidase